MTTPLKSVLAAIVVVGSANALGGEDPPPHSPLVTRFAKDVTPENVHAEYPRPQMVRPDWQNLNGLWDYAIAAADAPRPERFDGEILVPFPVESRLSRVERPLLPDQALWYRRTFEVPEAWRTNDQRLLLHFGAVDFAATAFVNGHEVGKHQGGFDPFSFEITDALTKDGPQELVVRVTDPTDSGTQPRGKQVLKPEGIWYTASSGIWQTVWLEPVPRNHFTALRIVPHFENGEVWIIPEIEGHLRGELTAKAYSVRMQVGDGSSAVTPLESIASWTTIRLKDVHPWTPESPYLYSLRVELLDHGIAMDAVDSYFGLRSMTLANDGAGPPRLLFNGKFLFQYGTLDQGFWPDGLFTPPSDAAIVAELSALKELGFNMIRKHVKVESARFYHHCDRLGLLVWQDMPSGDRAIGPDDPDIVRSEESERQFWHEWYAMLDAHRNAPSIVAWVMFNEGWGQSNPAGVDGLQSHMSRQVEQYRLIDQVSGWADRDGGDVRDIHVYPGPGMPAIERRRALVLGEFGGLGLPIEGHTWLPKGNWGYRSYESKEALAGAYLDLVKQLRPLIEDGLSAAVYTQTSDVEVEVNGLFTYDREILKVDADAVRKAHRALFEPLPRITVVAATADRDAADWSITTTAPADEWIDPTFDDSRWETERGGFGTHGTPGAVIGTTWDTSDLWLRRHFIAPPLTGSDSLSLRIHHDEDAEVFLNGTRIAELHGYTTSYVSIPLGPEARAALREGDNVLAIHCRQTWGGQFIDAGMSSRGKP